MKPSVKHAAYIALIVSLVAFGLALAALACSLTIGLNHAL